MCCHNVVNMLLQIWDLATRGAALGLLGKVYLYQNKWQEAHDVLKTVIDEGEYKLLDNFGDVWDVDHNNSEESLFEFTIYV